MNKASFGARVCAYLIDIFLVSFATSFISVMIPESKSVEKLYKEQNEIIGKYSEGKMNMMTYLNQSLDLSYQLSRQTALFSIISIFFSILYFCVYPFYHQGQTIGKNLLKIKIQKQDNSKLTMNDLVVRSSLINSIFFNIIVTALVLLTSKDVYIWGSTILDTVQYLFVIISVFLVAFSKEKNGLHDKLVQTEVVKVDLRIKEMEGEKCES